MKVESLRPYQKKVNLTVKAVNVNEPREVTSKLDDSKHSVTEALVGDDTGTILLTLWDDDISSVQPGQSYDIVNGFTSLFKQSIRLNIGRYGELKAAEVPIEAVNEANNLSGSEGEAPIPAPVEKAAHVKKTVVAKEAVAAKKTVAVEEAPVKEATEEAKEEGCDCADCPDCGSEHGEETVEEPISEEATAEPCECAECDECLDDSTEKKPIEKKKEESE